MRGVHTAIVFGLLVFGTSGVNAKTARVNTLTRVTFEGSDDALTFTFHARRAMASDAISASAEGDVLNLRLEQTKTRRRWVHLKDPSVKRSLLHPSKRDEPAAVLRVRMTEPVSDAVLRSVIVRAEGKKLVAAIPRDATVAAAWVGEEAPVNGAQDTEEAIPATEEAPAPEAVAVQAEAAPASAAEPIVLPPVEVTAEIEPKSTVAAHSEDAPLTIPEPNGVEQAEIAEMGLPAGDGPSLGALAMSMFFLMAVGFVVWRRLRPATASKPGGRAIRPVGSHMLGPKHHLLLVDVAGQLVLLGSGDKGVQMLTTIQPNDSVTPATDEVPIDAMPEAAQAAPTFADRLGHAVARIRDVARGVKKPAVTDEISTDDVEREFFRREKEAVAEAAEADALAALAEDVVDQPNLGRARMRRAARKAPTPPPAPKAENRASLENDLLRKIRRLQSA